MILSSYGNCGANNICQMNQYSFALPSAKNVKAGFGKKLNLTLIVWLPEYSGRSCSSMWMGSRIFWVSKHHCFIGREVRNISGLYSFMVMGLPKGHKLSIRQSSEDPSRIKELIRMKYVVLSSNTDKQRWRPILYLLMKELSMKLLVERIAILMKTPIILKAAKKMMTEEKKTVMASRRAKKKPKKTTGSLVIVSHKGLTSQLIKGWMWSFLTIHLSLTTFISYSLKTHFDEIASQTNNYATETIIS